MKIDRDFQFHVQNCKSDNMSREIKVPILSGIGRHADDVLCEVM